MGEPISQTGPLKILRFSFQDEPRKFACLRKGGKRVANFFLLRAERLYKAAVRRNRSLLKSTLESESPPSFADPPSYKKGADTFLFICRWLEAAERKGKTPQNRRIRPQVRPPSRMTRRRGPPGSRVTPGEPNSFPCLRTQAW